LDTSRFNAWKFNAQDVPAAPPNYVPNQNAQNTGQGALRRHEGWYKIAEMRSTWRSAHVEMPSLEFSMKSGICVKRFWSEDLKFAVL